MTEIDLRGSLECVQSELRYALGQLSPILTTDPGRMSIRDRAQRALDAMERAKAHCDEVLAAK